MKKLFALFLFSLIFVPNTIFAQDLLDEGSKEELQMLQEQIEQVEALRGEIAEAGADTAATSSEVRAQIVEIVDETEVGETRQIEFIAEDEAGNRYEVNTADSYTEGLRYDLRVGQKVYLQVLKQGGVVNQVFLVDVVRVGRMVALALLFAILVVAVGLWRGVSALFGLLLTLGILFGGILPAILAGSDPVLATVLGSIVILAINMHLSHGFNKPTFVAYMSTLVGLTLAVIFSHAYVFFAKLSGFASEEMVLLYFSSEYVQVPSGILLAGIILGAVGVLDDIAITQSETVTELLDANNKLSRKELFERAMRIGRHHIASTVNTLVLAYAGVAMPLLLLFMLTKDVGALRFINDELIAEEIVRTLAGTSALILTVPIATAFATWYQKR